VFGIVQRRVGGLISALGSGMSIAGSCAGAHCQRKRDGSRCKRRRHHGRDEPARRLERAAQRRVGQDRRELFSPVAVDGLVGPEVPHGSLCEFAQHGVTGGVAMRVVDRLEMIEVE
jgi:hypothetical protein